MPLKRVNVVVEGTMFVPPGEGDRPEHPIYIPVDPPPDSGLKPEHPIYIPVEPPEIWPSPGRPDNTLPGDQPRPDNTLPGQQPGGPRPDNTLPGDLPQAEHPIWIPIYPDNSLPGAQPGPSHPIYIPVYPAHPIELPPDGGTVPPIDIGDIPPQLLEKLEEFLTGNLPPSSGGPPYPSPVQGQGQQRQQRR